MSRPRVCEGTSHYRIPHLRNHSWHLPCLTTVRCLVGEGCRPQTGGEIGANQIAGITAGQGLNTGRSESQACMKNDPMRPNGDRSIGLVLWSSRTWFAGMLRNRTSARRLVVSLPHVAVAAGSAAVVDAVLASDAGRMGSHESPIQISAAGIRWDGAWGIWFLVCSSESILNVNLVQHSCSGKSTRLHFAQSVSQRDLGWRRFKQQSTFGMLAKPYLLHATMLNRGKRLEVEDSPATGRDTGKSKRSETLLRV